MIQKIIYNDKKNIHKDSNLNIAKIYMIHAFSIIGFVYLFYFGLKSIGTERNTLGLFLLAGSLIFSLNVFYLIRTENHTVSGYIILYVLSALMVYLLYTGGVHNTGHLWIFFLAPLIFYVNGLKKGIYLVLLFLMIMIVIFYILEPIVYDHEYKLRVVLSFLVVTLVSAAYEFSREKSSQYLIEIKKELEYLSIHDDLTGLYNRRALQDDVLNIKDTAGVILMCDIDHFKKINDTYGHAVGDFTIQEVAKGIQQNLGKNDITVRWGGEEFFIFLSEVNMKNAYNISEEIRESIEQLSIKYDDEIMMHLTMSIGIAQKPLDVSLADAIKYADSAMYLSKAAGRNKSTIY